MAGFGKKILSMMGLEEVPENEDEYYSNPSDPQPEQPAEIYDDDFEPVEEQSYGTTSRSTIGKLVGASSDGSKLSLLIYKPSSYEETQNIVDNLKSNRPIIVNLDELDTDVAQRILDFISGAVYALSGNIRKAARNIFVVAPMNVDVSTNLGQENMAAGAGDFDTHYFSDGDV